MDAFLEVTQQQIPNKRNDHCFTMGWPLNTFGVCKPDASLHRLEEALIGKPVLENFVELPRISRNSNSRQLFFSSTITQSAKLGKTVGCHVPAESGVILPSSIRLPEKGSNNQAW